MHATCCLSFLLLQKRKAAAAAPDSDGEQEEEGIDSEDAADSEEEERPKGRSKPAAKAASKPAASADPQVKKLQAICRQAGIKIGPSVYVKVCGVTGCCMAGGTSRQLCLQHAYDENSLEHMHVLSLHSHVCPFSRYLLTVPKCLLSCCVPTCVSVVASAVQNKDPGSLRSALRLLLEEHGLYESSDARSIARVKADLERQRDLEGIDLSNIIDEDSGRGGRRRAAARVDYKYVAKP